jgi:hypothetical protein
MRAPLILKTYSLSSLAAKSSSLSAFAAITITAFERPFCTIENEGAVAFWAFTNKLVMQEKSTTKREILERNKKFIQSILVP